MIDNKLGIKQEDYLIKEFLISNFSHKKIYLISNKCDEEE